MNLKSLYTSPPRLWKSTTGLSKKHYNLTLKEVFCNLGIQNPILESYEHCLFFVLFQLKNGLTFDVLGFIFNTDGSNAHRNFERYLFILEMTLQQEQMLPKRLYETVENLIAHLADEPDLIFDGTEFPIERPSDNDKQKKAFSGKKNARQKSADSIK
jgi:hypothetical protein